MNTPKCDNGLTYLGIRMPSRNNVREPLNPPELRIARPSGSVLTVRLNEAQLIEVVKDAALVLDHLRQRRNATVPDGEGG